jgi:hypothetical protein
LKQYLGEIWVKRHPRVLPAIMAVENLLSLEHASDEQESDRHPGGDRRP